MDFSFKDMEHVFARGLAKSRTLRSCHLIGVNVYGPQKFDQLLKILKARSAYQDDFCAKLDREILKSLFEKHKSVQDSS